jgi:hypothetical protein
MMITDPTYAVEAEIVETDYASATHLASKWFLLLLSGSIVYMAAFYGLVILGVIGASFLGGTVLSIRLRGQTILQSSAIAAAAIFEVLADCGATGTHVLERKIKPVIELNARKIQQYSGLLSEAEVEAIQNIAGGEVVVEEHIVELILGSTKKPQNTLILARKGSGKTTLEHGLIHWLLSSPTKNIVLAGDPNYGTGNDDGPPPAWAGLPRYDRKTVDPKDAVTHHRIFTRNDDIFAGLVALNSLYHRRMQLNEERAAANQPPERFIPVYFFVDEFQTFLGSLSDAQLATVNAFMGDLIRASKYKIFFFPIVHNDRATDGIDTTNLAGVNLLVLGSVLDTLKNDDTLRNSRKRFNDQNIAQIENKRREYDSRYGPDASAKMLGAIHLVEAFKTSDGTEFRSGVHLLRIPDYRPALQVRHDFSALTQPAPAPSPEADPNLALATEFVQFLRRRRADFEDKDYSVTAFSKQFQSNGSNAGWCRRRDSKDPQYCFLRDLAKTHPNGKINPIELLKDTEDVAI